jgi:hypothetical protein
MDEFDLDHYPGGPGSFDVHPINFAFDSRSAKILRPKYQKLLRRMPDTCIGFVYTGLLETWTDWSKAKEDNHDGTSRYIGFGHLNGSPMQLVMKSEDEVFPLAGCRASEP